MTLFRLTLKSIQSRQWISLLLMGSIALSVMLLIGVQNIQLSAKKGFSRSISGSDLIVGARSGDIQLLLYTVFRKGTPIANMSWDSFLDIQSMRSVKWAVPISLGDSLNGFPVLGTSMDYFKYFRYGQKKKLAIQSGRLFNDNDEVVMGAAVAKALGVNLNETVHLSHGIARSNLPVHRRHAFKIVGILNPTGTPVDQTVHVAIEAMTALHSTAALDEVPPPATITGAFVGLTAKPMIFSVKNTITQWEKEPLMAIIPGVALSQLWGIMAPIEDAFFVVTILVMLISFIGLLIVLLMALQQRQKELAILRALGASPLQLAMTLVFESIAMTGGGILLGGGLIALAHMVLSPIITATIGLDLIIGIQSLTDIGILLGIMVSAAIVSLIPAGLMYKKSQTVSMCVA